ncbi:two-pore potassium channel 3-like [Chenopodium quinoa]|uniref:Potassium channel domain-containing protein n=1 Tax=Chenopodium quinoa TaxID=63459 RepID=A0A803LRM7_CHEQI|nr:two-pore potassium channel 3-like [Chenopodium quinoa]
MNEPFLPQDVRVSQETSSPRARQPFPSAYIDRGSPRSSQSLRSLLLFNDATHPLLAAPRVNSIRRKLLDRQSTARLLKDDSTFPCPPPITSPLDKDLIINFDRSCSAPPLFTDEKGLVPLESFDHRHRTKKASRILQLALVGLMLYISVGVTVFTLTHDTFKGHRTDNKLVDALYFTVVTLSTIGYGDIIPASNFTKLFTCIFILVGFGFIDVLLNGLVTYVLESQEEVFLDDTKFNKIIRDYVIDKKKGRMRIRIKVCLALGAVFVFLTIGTITVHVFEKLNWVDSFYLSVTSVTTVGYGDHAFKTVGGRCFAIIWLLASTLAVAKAFLYLTEYRLEKRNRRMAKDVLKKRMTLGDLMEADIDHDGSISKAEYVIFKLKEMGKITDSDVEEICKEFNALDYTHSRRIAITDLAGGDSVSSSEDEHGEGSHGKT